MALNTYDGSRDAEVQADPLDKATSFNAINNDSPINNNFVFIIMKTIIINLL